MLETDSNSVGVKHNIENKIILISQWYELCMLPESWELLYCGY